MVIVSRPTLPLESLAVIVTTFVPGIIGIEALQLWSPTVPLPPWRAQSHPLPPVPVMEQQPTDWDAVPLPPAALFHVTETPMSATWFVPKKQLKKKDALKAVPDNSMVVSDGATVTASAEGFPMVRWPLFGGGSSSSSPPPQDTNTSTASPASKRLRSIKAPRLLYFPGAGGAMPITPIWPPYAPNGASPIPYLRSARSGVSGCAGSSGTAALTCSDESAVMPRWSGQANRFPPRHQRHRRRSLPTPSSPRCAQPRARRPDSARSESIAADH